MDGLNPPLITPSQLADLLSDPDVSLLDATWTFPGGPAPRVDGSIPGATFFDIDAIADPMSKLPHMLPAPTSFATSVGRLGVTNADTVVIYDRIGIFSAARAWWSFRRMGAERVFVLDGGLPAWIEEGYATDPGPPINACATPSRFVVHPRDELVADYLQVTDIVRHSKRQIVDARSKGRFLGETPEPRKGLRSGHMPGARNIPWSHLMTRYGRLRPPTELREVFERARVDPLGPLLTTCGSGVTACIIALAAARLGNENVIVYDGSWAEWGGRADSLVHTHI